MWRSWSTSSFVFAVGLVVAVINAVDGSLTAAVLWLGSFALIAYVFSPAFFPRSTTAAVARERGAADGGPVVYWRPGCQFCLMLRLRLGSSARRAHWVDIWRDPEAAADVRALTGGDETVPTVVAGDEHAVNPSARWVRAHLV